MLFLHRDQGGQGIKMGYNSGQQENTPPLLNYPTEEVKLLTALPQPTNQAARP